MDYSEILRELALVIAASYLIGSIPTGYIIVKLFTGQDIRTIGSGSTGATNVKRVMGKKWFFTVMLLDGFKRCASCCSHCILQCLHYVILVYYQ